MSTLKRGLNYVIAQCLTFPTLLLMFPGLYAAFRKGKSLPGLPVAIIAISIILYAIIIGGDFMPMARFLLPVLPFNAIIIGWMLYDSLCKTGGHKYIPSIVIFTAVMCSILAAWNINPLMDPIRSRGKMFHFRLSGDNYLSEYEHWNFEKTLANRWSKIGRALKSYAQPTDSYVIGAIGARGYYSDLFLYDQFGLINANVANNKFSGRIYSPGHDKVVPQEFFEDQKPTFIYTDIIPESELKNQIKYVKQYFAEVGKKNKTDFYDHYVADFSPTADFGDNGEKMFLIVFRRIPENIDYRTAWDELFKRW